jgi:SAM-dependent methyltransferase
VESRDGSRWKLRGDSAPAESFLVTQEEVLGRVEMPRLACSRVRRAARRYFLDLREAIVGEARPPEGDTSETVRLEYESQAPFYAAERIPEIDPALLEWMRRRLPADGPVLVAGSGTGRECMALARTGREVTGVDFSAEMVRKAEELAGEEGLRIRYLCEDLRSHREQAGSLAGILFTYDVYSFLPRREDRIRLLERMRNWLAPGGALFLSARRVTCLYDRLLLSAQWLVKGRRAGRVWGDTHTRYIGPDGVLHRSFVHAFTERGLRREAREAGLREEEWREGHGAWSPG